MDVRSKESSGRVESVVKESQFCGSRGGRAVEITAVALLALSLLAMGIYALFNGISIVPGAAMELSSGMSLSFGIGLIALSGVSLLSLYLIAPMHREELVMEEVDPDSSVIEEQPITKEEKKDPLEGVDLKSVTVELLKSPDFPWENLNEEQVAKLFPMDDYFDFSFTQTKLKNLGNNNIARWAIRLSGEQLRLLKPEQLSASDFPWDNLHEDQGKELFPYLSGEEEFQARNVTLHKLRALRLGTIDFLKKKGWITKVHTDAMQGVSTT